MKNLCSKQGFRSAAFLSFVGCTLAVYLLMGWVFRLGKAQLKQRQSVAASVESLETAVSEGFFLDWLERVEKLGNRFPGTSGHSNAARFVRTFYEERGFKVEELPVSTTVPVVQEASLRVGDVNIAISPFQPNLFQPDSTGDQGIIGRLMLFEERTLTQHADFSDVIAVVDAARPHSQLGLNAINYLRLGVKALIITNTREGTSDWRSWAEVVSGLPINFPRAYADAAILESIGERAHLRLRVRYESIPLATFVATRHGTERRSDEALVITTHYDSYSLLPWYHASPIQNGILAQHLAMVDGLSRYADSSRDLIVVASGGQFNNLSGEAAVLQAIGPNLERHRMGNLWAKEQVEHLELLRAVQKATRLLENRSDLHAHLTPFIQEQVRYVLETSSYFKTIERIRAKARFEEAGSQDLESEEYKAFSRVNREVERIRGLMGIPVGDLLKTHSTTLEQLGFWPALKVRFDRLGAFHRHRCDFLEVMSGIHGLTSGYRNLFHLSSFLVPEGEMGNRDSVTWIYGARERAFEQQESQYGALFREMGASIGSDLPADVAIIPPSKAAENQFVQLAIPSVIWSEFNYPTATFVQIDRMRSYQQLTNPFHRVSEEEWRTLSKPLLSVSRFALSLLEGSGSVRPPRRMNLARWDVGGRVLVSGIGQSVLPSYPLAGAVLGNKEANVSNYSQGFGFYPRYVTQTDPYGRYALSYKPVRLFLPNDYNLQAFDYDAAGVIRAAKDEGATAQKLYRSTKLPWGALTNNVTIVAFPATGVTFPDLINPQTLSPYASLSILSPHGLSIPARLNQFSTAEVNTVFLEPDTRFLLGYNAGSSENELVQRIRAFALGEPDAQQARDINGKGYLSLDSPIFREGYSQTAQSMLRVNTTRAEVQRRNHMLDPVTDEYLATSRGYLEASLSPDSNWLQRLLDSWDSITYSTIIHPVLRSNISQAILSVIWYLGLLVPFVFFLEKLAFGFADIRKQLGAQVAIFLISFGMLHFLHPAFGMIRSSLVILLGFGIFLICVALSLLFASKTSETLDGLRQKQSKVKAAEVNTLGILAMSFSLGLNNMHRRKVRTGLTCATLVLITFAMIAFTSIYDDFEEHQTVLGPAAYQGLLLKKDRFAGFKEAEVLALNMKYGEQFRVLPRRAVVGMSSFARQSIVPSLELTHGSGLGGVDGRRFEAKSLLTFFPADPLGKAFPMVNGTWLTSDQDGLPPVLLSDRMAESLRLAAGDVESGKATIQLNGRDVRVVGLFDSDALDQMKDLDGRSLLPFDVEALQSFEVDSGFSILADQSAPRVSAANVVIASPAIGLHENGSAETRIVSVVVDLEGVPYQGARKMIRQYVEQSGLRVNYGLDGAASTAIRRRSSSFEGLLDLLIPLFIAAMTVLNTMKGSVYERRDELYVYNAVGIAPRYIFAMFFAESLVYAVVGSVLGYFLSQSVGATLTALDLTGGLNMTFASLNSVYASLAVMMAVFLSTWFPAKTAVAIAATADESGWRIPESEGGRLVFDLPFLFDARERLAVLSFFRHFLSNHLEGDGGAFQASSPRPVIVTGEEAIPGIGAQIWLKPFDLGVSQEVELLVPQDLQSGEFVARIRLTHQSGTQEAWSRLNRTFIAVLRRQFLHWRAVGPEKKKDLFSETKCWFQQEAPTLSSNE